MHQVVNSVLKLTLGLLSGKIRRRIAERLKDGDVTDEECRRLIVRELDDIKSKLDGLARKDLKSSLCFLQEGINRLYESLFQLDSNGNTAETTKNATSVEATSSIGMGPDSVIDEATALINAMTSLEMRANDRFKSAIESFKLARVNATEAFGTEALSIEDRIEATQIRMMARILEMLEDPSASVSDCLQYLKQLHDIGAIQEIFSVLIDGGIRSRFNKTKRLDIASSVQLMNEILFEFARKFTKLAPRYLESWPVILLGKNSYRPVFGELGLRKKLEMSGVQVMSLNPDFTFNDKIDPCHSVVNSKGEILAPSQDQCSLRTFKRSGESLTVCEVPRDEHASIWHVTALDIDAENNIYLITVFYRSDEKLWSFKLFIFDENGKKKLESPLPFHHESFDRGPRMAISKDRKIAILDCQQKTLYIQKMSIEEYLSKFKKRLSFIQVEIKGRFFVKIMFADFSSRKIIVVDQFNIHIYTDNGQLERKIDTLKELGCLLSSAAINHVMKRILVKCNSSSGSSYSETGELMDSLNLGSSPWIRDAKLTSHLNGPVALVGETEAALLQL